MDAKGGQTGDFFTTPDKLVLEPNMSKSKSENIASRLRFSAILFEITFNFNPDFDYDYGIAHASTKTNQT
ncbi:hypothetical protein C6366_06480 [Desulfonatronum sp. SC1]|nr:hypothetical protein C6366_06480 [Desulfonatronum sp. SC1]